MEQKRVLLAVALSFAVIVLWQFIFPQNKQVPAPVEQAGQVAPAETAGHVPSPTDPANFPDADGKVPAPEAAKPAFAPAEGTPVTVKTPLFTAVLNSEGGLLEQFTLNKYRETIEPDSNLVDLVGPEARVKAPLGILIDGQATWADAEWNTAPADLNLETGTGTLVFKGVKNGVAIERHLTFQADNYIITEAVLITDASGRGGPRTVTFTAASKSLAPADDRYNVNRVTWFAPATGLEEITDEDDIKEGVDYTGQLNWGAIQSNYFIMALVSGEKESTFKAHLSDAIYRMGIDETAHLAGSAPATIKASYYFGPIERDKLDKAPGDLREAVYFGWFDAIAEPLLWMLDWLYKYVNNYGVAIILLTIIIKILFWPLSHKSYKSMEQMRKLQPMMQKLKEKYGSDKQKMNQEVMQLYRTYKVNPASGCVPMLLQIPVFFGLYKALLGAIELRHACFIKYLPFTDKLWLADLSAKDPYYITPIIMGATMFLQQKMSPTSADPTQAKMMLLMPVVFTFLFLNFPSGLVVYWLVNNILSIAQQGMMIRRPSKAQLTEFDSGERKYARI